MKGNYSLTEALELFNKEIAGSQKELDELDERMTRCRLEMLNTPISSDLEFNRLRILRICTNELLTALKRSRDRLIDEMVAVYL